MDVKKVLWVSISYQSTFIGTMFSLFLFRMEGTMYFPDGAQYILVGQYGIKITISVFSAAFNVSRFLWFGY
jgi:hypothetical protein